MAAVDLEMQHKVRIHLYKMKGISLLVVSEQMSLFKVLTLPPVSVTTVKFCISQQYLVLGIGFNDAGCHSTWKTTDTGLQDGPREDVSVSALLELH